MRRAKPMPATLSPRISGIRRGSWSYRSSRRKRSVASTPGSLGTVLGVWAHPDDETYLSAGVLGESGRGGAPGGCGAGTPGGGGARGGGGGGSRPTRGGPEGREK